MQKLNLTKTQKYWLLQILGWSSIVFVETINYTFFIIQRFDWHFVVQFCLLSLSGLLASHIYKNLFIKPSLFEKSLSRIWFRALLDTFFITLTMVVIFFLPLIFTETDLPSFEVFLIQFFGQMMNVARYVVVWIIIYYLYHILNRNKDISEQKLLIETLVKTSELELLKSQLNPHFLFNALNSIKALVLIDADKAREAIIKLSELLRFTLNYEKTLLINLSDEINEVVKYLELEKIRFGDRLDVNIDLEADSLDAKVPPAMVLTLAENAIKHGINHLPDGGVIGITSSISSKMFKIEVTNPGKLKIGEHKGIGLNNIRKRLKSLFGENAEINLSNKLPDQISVTIIYPLTYTSYDKEMLHR
ncbi:sensor histidine kinase [Aquiflexum lacus]|uniref:sensor histidine kinase n=1 Tax=Aquiflexum lacus TaxID=2483805 RepID=UPI001895E24F|nr:histidine kinase [Aquiflexum lacus]